MRYTLTDDLWDLLAPHVGRAKRFRGGPPPVVPDRLSFEAIPDWARTGVPWRDRPGGCGSWDAASRRFARRPRSGGLTALFESPAAGPDLGAARRVRLDATAGRPRPHAAGARRKEKRSGRSAVLAGRAAAAAGAGGVPRSSSRPPTRARVWPSRSGPAGEAPRPGPLLDATRDRVPHFDELVCDRGCDGDGRRPACVARDVFPNVPGERSRVGPQPSRPGGGRERNTVERLFGTAKPFGRLATRYEKRKAMFLGVVHRVFSFSRLRRLRNDHTP